MFLGQQDKDFELFVVQNRVMLILERFFTRLYQKLSSTTIHLRLTAEEISRLRLAEAELVKDFSLPPPAIQQLARLVAMSPSRLKNLFKQMYGLPLYQYFQKHRMVKAKAMLVSKKYTAKQIAAELGYQNQSLFTKAFKNFFEQLPEEILGS
jgi:AraC-like DNA-binding protein